MKRFLPIKIVLPLVMMAVGPWSLAQPETTAGGSAAGNAPGGLDALDEGRVMAELANRGMETLLKREFEVNKTPLDQQNGILTLISIQKLSDPAVKLSAKERQDLLQGISRGVEAALPTLRDPTSLMQMAKVLLTSGVEPDVTTLEYWGENPRTQAQVRPLAESVYRIYEKAASEAGKKADQLAGQLTAEDDPISKRWQAADQLRTLAGFSQNMAVYDLCISLDKADPRRKELAAKAIEFLAQFDTNDSAVQASVRNRIAKLNMVRGDYYNARKVFETVIRNPKDEIKPPPTLAEQYEARYFSIVCRILDRKLPEAQKEMDTLAAWQNASLDPRQQQGASAAFTMLKYRILTTQADTAAEDEKKKDNDAAIAVLMQLLKDQPQYESTIYQQMLTRLPENPQLSRLDPLLLLAIQQQGEQEYLKPADAKVDVRTMERAVAAAREIISRDGKSGVDAATASRSSYVLPYLLERAGDAKEAAKAFLDFAAKNPTENKKANDALDHATALIGQLRKADMEDAETSKLYDRFLPIAIGPPYLRRQFSFEYARLLQQEQKYSKAIEYFSQVPPDDKRHLMAQFYEMVALKQRLNDDNDKMSASERKSAMAQIQSLADTVNKEASVPTPDEADQKRNALMLESTALLAADLANHEQKDPKRALDLLAGFEDKVKGMPNEQDLLFQALSLRVNSYMALGQANDATSTLVQLLKTKQGNEGPALVFDLLKKLASDMDHARSIGDMNQVKQLARNRAALSGFLVTWAEGNSDEKIKALAPKYKAFDASTQQLAAELTDDPVAKKAGLEAARKLYQDLYDPANPNPVVQLGLGFVQFDLGDYKSAKEILGPLVANKKVGTPTEVITENGESKTVENTQYWEATLKLLRSVAEVARQNPDDAQAKTDLESAQRFLKQQYVLWPTTIGGKKYHDDFEKLRAEITPDFHPGDTEAASQPVAGS